MQKHYSPNRSRPLRLLLLCALFLAIAPWAKAQTSKFVEFFDSGTKTDYAPSAVTFGSGSWTLDDAILGGTDLDRRNGTQSVRIRQRGKLTMNFNLPSGVGMVRLRHGLYSNDGSSAWELWAMQDDNCDQWEKVGATVVSTGTNLETALFAVNLAGPVKLEVRKVSGGASQLNIDDFEVSDFGSSLSGIYPDNDHLALGNPSGAVADVSVPTNYLMRKPQYALSYNRDRGINNWVSWHLQSADLGSFDRSNDFFEDTSLPAGWFRAQENSYSNSGFDRGHNTPSADRTATETSNDATFLMTNIIPQAPLHNQGLWGDLEAYTRSLLSGGNEVYVIMGNYGVGGKGANGGTTNSIAGGNITVPARIWKVIVVIPGGNNDVSRINQNTRVIAVDTPNDNAIGTGWGRFRTSVDVIEKATGLDLLSNLPTSVQNAVEAKVDAGPTN